MPLYLPLTNTAPNLIFNPTTVVSQRYVGVATVITDNAYWADRWRYIGEASATCTASDTTVGGGRTNGAIKFTGTTDKGGAFQVLEGKDCGHLRSTLVSLGAVLSVSSTRLGNIKMGIAEFTGTEDAVSGDPVTTWGADGTTPTLAASWAFLNTPANLSVTTSPVTYTVSATCGASMNNLAVIIWNDDKVYTANDAMYFTDVQLKRGSSVGTFDPPEIFAIQLARCQRYFQKSATINTVIGTANDANFFGLVSFNPVAAQYYYQTIFAVRMRALPAITIYPYTTPTNTGRSSNGSGTDYGAGSGDVPTGAVSEGFFAVRNNTAGTLTVTQGIIIFAWYASAEL